MNSPPHPDEGLPALRAGFGVTPDAMLAVDASGRIVFANPLAEQMFGYPPAGLQDLLADRIVRELPRAGCLIGEEPGTAAPYPGPTTIHAESTGLKHDGQAFPVDFCLRRLCIDGGPVALISIRDISATRRVQLALARARYDAFRAQISSLALESPDYESAIQRIPEQLAHALAVPAVAILSADWHRNTFRIRAGTGLSAITADALATIFGDGELTHRAFEQADHAIITSDAPRNEIAVRICAGLERTRYRHFALAPLFGRYEPLGALVALTADDSTFDADQLNLLRSIANLLTATVQRSHAEEQLAHAQRLDAVGQLTGGVAHDFNNLLTVVSGNLQLLEASLANNHAAAREAVDAALRAVDRGAELTRKLLTFARRQALQPAAVNPESMLRELGYMLRRTLGETIAIRTECAADVPDVYADPGELETAMVNLAVNARDAMPRGGQLTLLAKASTVDPDDDRKGLSPGRYVAFSVTDTGTGMAPDVQARACEPFFTTKDVGKGSGLGLSMVYGFVMQSGGHLTVDSRLGYGTRIEFLLPVAHDVAAPSARGDGEGRLLQGSGTVLVVEDEPEVRRVAAAFLREAGYDVLAAGGVEEALEKLAAHPRIDLLFSDVVLGGPIDGVGLAREARRSHPGLAVLLASGYAGSAAEASSTTTAAAFPLLRKPYRREQLQRAVQAALEDVQAGPSVDRGG